MRETELLRLDGFRSSCGFKLTILASLARCLLCRFAEARTKRPGTELRYEFVDSPKLGTEEWLEPAQYDVVTCMFAIHYFFVAEKALKQVGA